MAFIIIGNASSGTSFCSYVMDDHPAIVCPFEDFEADYDLTLKLWRTRIAENPGLIYGTKVPIEEVILRHWRWSPDQIVALVDAFDIIFNWRDFTSWLESWNDHQNPKLDAEQGYQWWNQGWELALMMRSRRPGRVIFNPYHRLRHHLQEQSALLYTFVGAGPHEPNAAIVREPKH